MIKTDNMASIDNFLLQILLLSSAADSRIFSNEFIQTTGFCELGLSIAAAK
jgi:hypothetical protein